MAELAERYVFRMAEEKEWTDGRRTHDLLNAMCLTAHLRGPMHGYPPELLEVAVARSYPGLPFRVVVATGPRNRAEVTS